jgi:ATP-binding cassette subfamily C protein CydD
VANPGLARLLRGLTSRFVTLKIFGRHTSQSVRIEEMGDRYTRETMKVLKISFLSALALELAATISVALIAVTIGLRLVNGSISFTSFSGIDLWPRGLLSGP